MRVFGIFKLMGSKIGHCQIQIRPLRVETGQYRTLNIGGADIPCAVLPDGTRLLTQAGFLGALGRSTKPKGRSQQVADGLPPFLSTISLKPLITQDIIDTTVPIIFRTESGARAQGYKAELLPKVCNLFLSARDQGLLTAQQQDIAANPAGPSGPSRRRWRRWPAGSNWGRS